MGIKNDPGQEVVVQDGFFEDRVGVVDEKQDGTQGVFVQMSARDSEDSPPRRLWFPAGSLRRKS